MATIAQKPLFGWDQIEALGDLKRLQLALENLPDEPVVSKLEQERDRGRVPVASNGHSANASERIFLDA